MYFALVLIVFEKPMEYNDEKLFNISIVNLEFMEQMLH